MSDNLNMKPYNNIRHQMGKYTDISDIQNVALKTSMSGVTRGIIKNKANKAKIRRNLKRSNNAIMDKIDFGY